MKQTQKMRNNIAVDLEENNNENISENKVNKNIDTLRISSKNIKNALKLFFKLFFAVFCIFCIVISSLFFIAPKVDAKIFNFLGLKNAEEGCYIQVYKKSQNSADLYNLILFEKQHNNLKKELEYIQLLELKEDFEEFCEKMNNTGIDFAKDKKNQYIYYADVQSYFITRKLNCKFKLNFDFKANYDLSLEIIKNLENDCFTETSFYELINLILKYDKFTSLEKKNLINDIFTSQNGIINLVLQRIENIELKIGDEENEVSKILLQNSLVKHIRGIYYYEVIVNGKETETAKAYEAAYSAAYESYINLVR